MLWQNYATTIFIAISGGTGAAASILKPESNKIKMILLVVIILSTFSAAIFSTWGQQLLSDKQKYVQNNRIEIQNKFADLIEEGQVVESIVLNPMPRDEPEKNVQAWDSRVTTFLQEKLGRVYVLRYFGNTGVMPVGARGVDPTSAKGILWARVHSHLEHLSQFSAQIPPVE